MPGRDGTGPLGQGCMTGRCLGACTGFNAARYGAYAGRGLGLERRCGQGYGYGRTFFDTPQTQKESLERQKDLLESRLDAINKHLERP